MESMSVSQFLINHNDIDHTDLFDIEISDLTLRYELQKYHNIEWIYQTEYVNMISVWGVWQITQYIQAAQNVPVWANSQLIAFPTPIPL